jgi:FixJ family two-component response regulator
MSESVPQIYVVDDDVSVREAVGSLIKSAGLSVRTFAFGAGDAHQFAKGAPGLFGVGYPTSRHQRLRTTTGAGDQRHSDPDYIFLTGHGDIPMSVRAIKAGALEFLTKPFEDEYLLEAIRIAIARDNRNERSPGRIAKEYFEEFTGTDGASRAVPNQPEIVISSHLTGSGNRELVAKYKIGCRRARAL